MNFSFLQWQVCYIYWFQYYSIIFCSDNYSNAQMNCTHVVLKYTHLNGYPKMQFVFLRALIHDGHNLSNMNQYRLLFFHEQWSDFMITPTVLFHQEIFLLVLLQLRKVKQIYSCRYLMPLLILSVYRHLFFPCWKHSIDGRQTWII